MRNKNICVFVSEDDCPKEAVRLTCEECEKHKHYETITKAVEDFASLGESFTDLFAFCNKLVANNGTTAEVVIPVESIHKINRVMNAFLTAREDFTGDETMYRRLIFYFFDIVIDEFNEEEYIDNYIH